VTAEPESVTARDCADVADRAAPDPLGQLEDLGHGQAALMAGLAGFGQEPLGSEGGTKDPPCQERSSKAQQATSLRYPGGGELRDRPDHFRRK